MIPSGQFVGFALLVEEEEFEPRMTPITPIGSRHGGCLQGRKLSDHDYKGHRLRQTYKPDFICFEKIIVELKAASELTDAGTCLRADGDRSILDHPRGLR